MDEDAILIDPIFASASDAFDAYQEEDEGANAIIAEGITIRIFLPPFIAFRRLDSYLMIRLLLLLIPLLLALISK